MVVLGFLGFTGGDPVEDKAEVPGETGIAGTAGATDDSSGAPH